MELEFQWNLLMEDCIPEAIEKLFKEVKDQMIWFKEQALGEWKRDCRLVSFGPDPQHADLRLDTFAQSLDLRVREIQYNFDQTRQHLVGDVRYVRLCISAF